MQENLIFVFDISILFCRNWSIRPTNPICNFFPKRCCNLTIFYQKTLLFIFPAMDRGNCTSAKFEWILNTYSIILIILFYSNVFFQKTKKVIESISNCGENYRHDHLNLYITLLLQINDIEPNSIELYMTCKDVIYIDVLYDKYYVYEAFSIFMQR